MSKKIYNLTIAYDSKTDEIEYIEEGIEDGQEFYMIGGILLNEYFDKETLELLSEDYILGES
jgi:hypothetical protein